MFRFAIIITGTFFCLSHQAFSAESVEDHELSLSQEKYRSLSRIKTQTSSILRALKRIKNTESGEGVDEEEVEYQKILREWAAENNEPLEIILSLKRRGKHLNRSLIGIQKGTSVYVPLMNVAAIIKVPVNFDAQSRTVSGFIGNKSQAYSINTAQNIYSFKGNEYALAEDSVIVKDFGNGLSEIYVTPELLNTIWGFRLRLNLEDLALIIDTPKLLPFERERLRKIRQEEFLVTSAPAPEHERFEYSYVPNEYKLIGKPALNINSQVNWTDRNDQLAQIVNVRGVNDLLGAGADYNVQFRNDNEDGVDLRNARLRLTRRADIGNELPFGLKKVEAGDVSFKPPDLVDRNVNGAGITFSNKPFKKSQSFDVITIEGNGQPGWEVEIYNGNRLEDFGVIDNTGQYRFDDIELSYGVNQIRTVLYGPQGQVEESVEEYDIASSLLAKGDTVFEGAILDANQNLFEVQDVAERSTDGYFHTAKLKTGFNEQLTPFVSMTSANSQDGRKNYITAGANYSALGGLGIVEAYKDLSGGVALDNRFSKNFLGARLNLRSSVFRDFESQEANFGGRRKTSENELRAQTSIPIQGMQNLGLNFNARHTRFEDGANTSDFSAAQSISIPSARFGNRINTRYNNGNHNNTNGRFNILQRFNEFWALRSVLNYELFPDTEFNSARVEARYNDRDKFSSSLDITQDLNDNNTVFGADASYDFGSFLGGAGINYDPGDGVDFVLRTSMSLGPFDEDGSYLVSSRDLTNRRALDGRIYHDKDEDGVFSEGDVPIEGARLKVNGLRTDESDADGFIIDPTPGALGLANITVDEASLDNELLVSQEQGYYTALRPVTKPYVDVPLVVSGALEGSAYFPDGQPAPTVRLQLVDAAGLIHQETVTDFNGYYNFNYVRPGQYEVRKDPDQKIALKPVTVTVSQDDPFVYGVNLKARPLRLSEGGALLSTLQRVLSLAKKKREAI